MARDVVTLAAPQVSAYDEELARASAEIADLGARVRQNRRDLEKRVRLAYRLFHRASLEGLLAGFGDVETAIAGIIADFGPKEDVCLLKANLDFRFHRLAEVKADLHMEPMLSKRFEGRVLLADLDFQEGCYQAAREGFEDLIKENRTWDNLARLAHWHGKFGDVGEADRLYVEAEDGLTAKQMRSFAWLELQRGVLAFSHGQYEAVWTHYRRADAAFPGHWHTGEHFAELLAAEGRFDEAESLFLSVIARAPKPELQQALGEMYLFMGRPETAQPWFENALSVYLESAQRGEVHYYHHLADFYADAGKNPADAVGWARKDISLRSNFSTQAALAWALYRNGSIAEAVSCIRQALSSGVQDSSIFSTAAIVFDAAAQAGESERYARAALAVNPRRGNFHMHH